MKLIELIKPLVEAGADVNKEDDYGTYLAAAAMEGDYELVVSLVKAGASVDFIGRNGETALMSTVGNHNEIKRNKLKRHKVVKFLIMKGANVNFREGGSNSREAWSVLMHAIHENTDIRIVESLINSGANVKDIAFDVMDSEDDHLFYDGSTTPMSLAKYHNREDIISLLE